MKRKGAFIYCVKAISRVTEAERALGALSAAKSKALSVLRYLTLGILDSLLFAALLLDFVQPKRLCQSQNVAEDVNGEQCRHCEL